MMKMKDGHVHGTPFRWVCSLTHAAHGLFHGHGLLSASRAVPVRVRWRGCCQWHGSRSSNLELRISLHLQVGAGRRKSVYADANSRNHVTFSFHFPQNESENLENSENNNGLMGCKWSSLNAPVTENPLSHSVLELEEFPFPIIGPLG